MDIRAGCRARPERILANGWKRGDEVKRSSPGPSLPRCARRLAPPLRES